MNFLPGLRGRLALLVVVALLPLVGLSIHKAWRDAQSAREGADASLQFTASLAASHLSHTAESARSLLLAVASTPGLRETKASGCGEYLARLHERFPAYASFGIVDGDGRLQCRTRAVTGITSTGNSARFRELLQRNQFIVSAILRGAAPEPAIVAFGQPVSDAQGHPVAMVFATMELSAVLRSVEDIPLAPGAQLLMLDRNATVLAARPASAAVPGAPATDAAVRDAVARPSPALAEGAGADGSIRIYALEPSHGAAAGAIFASVSMDRSGVLEPIRRTLAIELGSLALVAALGIALAWTLGRRTIVVPAERIVDATQRLRLGHLDERVPEPRGGEMGRIARAFNVMADSLQQRDRDNETENARSRNTFEVLDLVLNSLQDAMIAADLDGNFLIFNRVAALTFPDGSGGVDPVNWARHFGMYELDTHQLLEPEEVPLFRAIRGKYGSGRDILVRNPLVPQGKILRCHFRPMVRGSEVVGGLAVFTDLTELHELEEARVRDDARLKDLNARLVTAQRIGRIGHWELDLGTNRFWWSAEMYGLVGMEGGFDGTYGAFLSHVHPEDRETFAQLHTAALREGEYESSYRIVTPAGETRWLQERAELRRDAAGRAQTLAGVAQDVTARMKAEGEARSYTQQLQRAIAEISELNATLEAKVADRTAALARQEALFRALAEEAPQVVWTIDDKGRVTYLNRAWFDLVGGKDGTSIGAGWLQALHPEDLGDVAATWQHARSSGQPFSGIRRIRASDGTWHTMAYRGAPVPAPDGTVDFWVGIDADITELKGIEDALRRSNQELEAFSYSVSHDLRAPLSTIDGFSKLLARMLEGVTAEKAHHYLGRIQTAAAEMGQLIEALLSLAQVTRAKLKHESVDIAQMAREILAVLRSRDPAREVETVVEPGVTMPGDPRLVRVLMENLLGNAWKFTGKTPRARIEVGRIGHEVFVRDNGVGFDMAYADKLFAAFQRLHSADDFPGTGIGLATVGRVVARHGGTIRALSGPGPGAVFYFCLPETPPAARAGETD